ncbi:histidine phosphatase family protein [Microvirga pudoricolor]|uniref:histidine phosphatase family protein n=1 Tax=Microvirga pudoricolor TaxID=2778729 RepID=UPI001951001D|nr:histidine phosphatase family protein [Microvirga pudoricolor]MBM6593787.1 histidine phosphatase family protein [Microvirga pudoricolor]
MARIIFLTHPEVVIDPAVPVPDWPLSETGLRRMEAFARTLEGSGVTAVHASRERKALDGAEIVAGHLGLALRAEHDLGENDRSATGYIAPPEFWAVVKEFFGRPHESVRGWERAVDAQARIVAAVGRVAREEPTGGDILIVSHGGVGCLLTAHLQGVPIGREDRPSHPGGGCHIVLDRDTLALLAPWRTVEQGLGPGVNP